MAKKIKYKIEETVPRTLDLTAATDPHMAETIYELTGTNTRTCLSCLSCSGGCPFFKAMDLGPHGVMRRINFGLRRQLLESNTIWLCVGCHTCSSVCPMGIDIASAMDVLREMALECGIPPAEPAVLNFHQEVLKSIERHGRTHKMEIMLRYKIRSRSWLDDMDLGLRMLAKRKLDLRPSKVKDSDALSTLFDKPWRR